MKCELSRNALVTPEVFVSHRNAPLPETGRLRLARCVVDDGWPLRRAAERFQVSVTTAARWAGRYREHGPAGMVDRSSRPHRSPHRTPKRTERRIIKVRVSRRWGPARIGYLLGIHPSTVHRVLTRYGLARLRWLDRPTGRVIRRMEPARCRDMVDVKKLGKIPAGDGWRMLGRTVGKHNAQADKSSGVLNQCRQPVRGYHFLHTVWRDALRDRRISTEQRRCGTIGGCPPRDQLRQSARAAGHTREAKPGPDALSGPLNCSVTHTGEVAQSWP